MWAMPTVTDEDLLAVERAIRCGIETRSTEGLTVLGLGELGLAVGWPTDDPVAVCKRQAPGPEDQLDADLERMGRFREALVAAGAAVVPTVIRTVRNDAGTRVPYLIQPKVDPAHLAENVIATSEPSATHALLISVRDTVTTVVRDDEAGGLSLDAQITNFAWDGERATLLDLTPVLIWDAASGPMHEIGNYLTAVPYVLRPAATALTRRSGADYRTVRGVLRQTVVYLRRIGQDRWVNAALQCFNEVVDEPITNAEVDAAFTRVGRDLPMIKRLARVQRMWATHVRKQPYEFFITNSFTGEVY